MTTAPTTTDPTISMMVIFPLVKKLLTGLVWKKAISTLLTTTV
jgi:hypothetical protein